MKKKKNFFFAFKPFLYSVIIYFIGLTFFTVWTIIAERKRIISEVDAQLLHAALSIREVLPADYHDRALSKGSISDSEHFQNIVLLSKCAKTAGVKYLYTAVIHEGKVYFTSSSATDKEFIQHDLPTFWQEYPESTTTFKNAINGSEPVFESSSDRWGTFESALIPMRSSDGNKYLVGADMDISFLRDKILGRIPSIIIMSLFFLFIVLPVLAAIRNSYKKNTIRLEKLIAERIQAEKELLEYKANLEEIIKSRTEQLEREIADRKIIQEELHEAKELAIRESRAKSIFLANMSHEIRTPMNGVIGMTNILKETDLTPEQREYLDIIDLSGNNLMEIINDILDFSKIEAGQVELENIPFNLPQQVDEVTKILNTRAGSKGLRLFFTVSSELPEMVKGDPVRFKQVIMNLTNNAIKFTEEGSITIDIVPVWQDQEKLMIRCNVVDTGIGISQKGKDKLFKEFSQSEISTTRKYGGTGLGLKISKDLTRLMGGEIGVESEESRGSTFWFTAVFDKIGHAETDLQGEDKEKKLARALAILLVEDNYISQKVAMTSLERDGYTNIEIAENGRIAVKKMHERNYDLILMDIRMPVMDGLEATEKIREFEKKNPGRSPAYIVAFTAYAVEGDRERFLEAGMDDYIAKPFQPEELIRVINKYSTKKRFRSLRILEILLAEDNKINQKVAVKTLESFGHRVEVVETGTAAVERFRQKAYDLIMMDLEMPEMDGVEATRQIRKMEREFQEKGEKRNRVKIVALTAHSTVDDRKRCLAAGMDDYMSKPFRQADLARTLNI
jgi:signal transduction histidine kinase/DNA-binding response OmpR family regulator